MTVARPERLTQQTTEPPVPRLVGVVWALLVINVLGFNVRPVIFPFPERLAQVVTMGALGAAFTIALLLNPRIRIRPSTYLLLLALLVVVSGATALRMESGMDSALRSGRFAVFLATLWLISPWWRGDLTFVRYQIRALGAVLLTVLAGLAISPGTALPEAYDGRLFGALWPIPAPQVGHYAAVVGGLTILLWLSRNVGGRTAAAISLPAIGILLLSHTRTATIAVIAALAAASLTLALTNARSRRAVGVTALFGGLLAVAFTPALRSWFARGQDPELLTSLTGRQKAWEALLAEERTPYQQALGVGLTDKTFGGLSIDNSWLAIYHEEGWVGVVLVVAVLVCLLAAAALRPPSSARACAVFLILYCAIASYAEVGLGDASPYLLHLAVAASLLVPGAPDASRDAPLPQGRPA